MNEKREVKRMIHIVVDSEGNSYKGSLLRCCGDSVVLSLLGGGEFSASAKHVSAITLVDDVEPGLPKL